MIKRRKGDGPHMVLEIPYEFDCEYYTRYGYCKLRKKHCNHTDSVDECLELLNSSEEFDNGDIIESTEEICKKTIFLNENCKVARISDKKEIVGSFIYNTVENRFFFKSENFSIKLSKTTINNLMLGTDLKSDKKDFKIYASLNSFKKRKIKLNSIVEHKNLGKGVVVEMSDIKFKVRFKNGNYMSFIYENYNDCYFNLKS